MGGVARNPGREGEGIQVARVAALGRGLDLLAARYGPASLANDPLSLVRRYPDPRDREVAGLVAAGLAFGSVRQVLRSGAAVLDPLGPHPARRVTGRRPAVCDPDFRHRWVTGEDLTLLFSVLGRILDGWGTVERFFLAGYDPAAPDIGPALDSFSRRARALAPAPGRDRRGFRFLFPGADRGGAAKRLCLFARWMVREDDGTDLGVWRQVPASALVIPLDTHVLRISRYIGLTNRRTATFATAREITASLRALDAEDPVRYDFAIAQLGISRGCRHRRIESVCGACTLSPMCRI
jgi:uncharacterized protein (TIGR02757 family)